MRTEPSCVVSLRSMSIDSNISRSEFQDRNMLNKHIQSDRILSAYCGLYIFYILLYYPIIKTAEFDQMADIKNNYEEIASLVCLCRSYTDISIKWRLFHNKLKTP